jgi:hypothetical protein
VLDAFPPADLIVERIGDLMDYDLPRLLAASRKSQSSLGVTR